MNEHVRMNAPAPSLPRPSQLRSRLVLLLVAAMFLGSFFVAAALRFSGWSPQHTRNFGELLQPPLPLNGIVLHRIDGTPYPWAPERNRWRLLALPAPGCTVACTSTLDLLHRAWLSMGQKADRLDVLWVGPLPAGAPSFHSLVVIAPDARLATLLPEASRVDALPVYLVDSSGYVALHYRPGFDPNGLRKDLGKLLK